MKGPATSALRSLPSSTSRQVRVSNKDFSTSRYCNREVSSEAESSQAARRPAKGEAYPDETREEAFQRNLKEVQAWRRRKEAFHIKTPFIPPSRTPPPTTPTPMRTAVSTLLAAGAALGCSTSALNTAFAPYVYGNRSGLSIIDLDETIPLLRRAAAVVRDVVKADGVVLFVGTRPGMKRTLDRAKERLGDNGYITNKWLPGLLTNAETLFGVQPVLQKQTLPDLVVFLNPADNILSVRECNIRGLPTIGIIDSNTDPRAVTYPIPANVESLRTSNIVAGALSLAGQEGRRLRLKEADARAQRQGGRNRSQRSGDARDSGN